MFVILLIFYPKVIFRHQKKKPWLILWRHIKTIHGNYFYFMIGKEYFKPTVWAISFWLLPLMIIHHIMRLDLTLKHYGITLFKYRRVTNTFYRDWPKQSNLFKIKSRSILVMKSLEKTWRKTKQLCCFCWIRKQEVDKKESNQRKYFARRFIYLKIFPRICYNVLLTALIINKILKLNTSN